MDELIKLMDTVKQDLEQDMKNFDGRVLNGKNVAELFGYQAAAISAVADTVQFVLKQLKDK